VQGNIQPKLVVGEGNDPLEHEADRVAEQVMRTPDANVSIAGASGQLSKKSAASEQAESQTLQPERVGSLAAAGNGAPGRVHEVLRSHGQPLDTTARAFFEPRFGQSFEHVRIHADADAAASAREMNALAYTFGRDIVFADSHYQPATNAGRTLLAHELAHVAQQRRHVAGEASSARATSPGDSAEHEARVAADAVVSGDVSETLTDRPLAIARQAVAPADTAHPGGATTPTWIQSILFGNVTTPPWAAAAGGVASRPKFTNPLIQRTYNDAARKKPPLSANQVEALLALDVSLTGPWAHLSWTIIAGSAADRVVNPSLIDQVLLDVCASAAALEAEAANNAKGYAHEVCQVFSRAKIGDTYVNKYLLNGTPVNGMDACDWMMLSAAQDASNLGLPFGGKSGWGVGVGTVPPGLEWLLTNLSDCVQTEWISCVVFGEDAATKKVSDLMAKYGDKVVVTVYCDSEMLDSKTPNKAPDGTGDPSHLPDHVVRLINITFGKTVDFKIFTWGKEMPLKWTVERYRKWVYGYVVGAREAGILLP